MRERENPVNPTVFAGVSALEETVAVLVRLPALRRNPSAGWGTRERASRPYLWMVEEEALAPVACNGAVTGFFSALGFPPKKTGTGGGVSPGISK